MPDSQASLRSLRASSAPTLPHISLWRSKGYPQLPFTPFLWVYFPETWVKEGPLLNQYFIAWDSVHVDKFISSVKHFYIQNKILQNDWHCKRITFPRSWNSKRFLCVWHFILQVFQSLLLELLYNFLFHSLFSPVIRLTYPLRQAHSCHSPQWGWIQWTFLIPILLSLPASLTQWITLPLL